MDASEDRSSGKWRRRSSILRYRIVLTVLMVAMSLVLTIAVSISAGSVSLSPIELWQALLHQGEPINQTIFWQLRLPRVAAALSVGAALGASGALLQGMLRNSLATPSLLGIPSGAGFVVIILVSLSKPQGWFPLLAWVGAIVATVLVYLLAKRGNQIAIERLILGGVAISSLLGAIQTVLILWLEDGRIQQALNWIVGSLNGRGWAEVRVASPYIAVAILMACGLARSLNVLSLGDELAEGLGTSLARSRIFIGGTAALLAAGAVSIAGLVGFVDLIVPHGIRLLIGNNDHRWVIPLSAAGGALVLTFADLLSRLGSVELPVGAVTALLGSPLFIALLYRSSATNSE
ncbi:FecCD family ABC transporter permease [Lusitaniella coriacea]|uniref:FecCD family ABC transporter permease n=1 Tax=Lusitaniella coriacea TaxID=1983105 RepID=UPI003CE86DCE